MEEIKIDVSRLSRDYSKEPLKRCTSKGRGYCNELIPLEDLKYLYLELNMTFEEIAKYLQMPCTTLQHYAHNYGVRKDNKAIQITTERTSYKKYGERRPQQSQVVKDNIEKTFLKNYGCKSSLQAPEIKDKATKTLVDKYGVDNVFKNTDMQKLIRLKIQNKYGTPTYAQSLLSKSTFEITSDKTKLITFVENSVNRTPQFIAKELKYDYTTLLGKIHEYHLEDYFQMNKACKEEAVGIEFLGVFKKCRGILSPHEEIDLYNEERKLGIEFNGNYWHSDIYKDKKYHQDKSLKAEKKDVFIYHIFEYEWDDKHKKEVIVSQINNLLGRNNNKIYARKCQIKVVSVKDKNYFLKNNHIQGEDNSSIKIGLYYKNELISLMTFTPPHFYKGKNKKYEWELTRFCSKIGTSVVGGASKLFKHFVRGYNPKSIISYSDIAKTKGKMYEMLGFNDIGITEPNYKWTKGNIVLNKSSCRKKQLAKQGFTDGTENSIMRSQGFSKLYDCGVKKWLWKSEKE